MAALGLINSNGTGAAAALGQIKINLVPKVIVPKGHGEKKKKKGRKHKWQQEQQKRQAQQK